MHDNLVGGVAPPLPFAVRARCAVRHAHVAQGDVLEITRQHGLPPLLPARSHITNDHSRLSTRAAEGSISGPDGVSDYRTIRAGGGQRTGLTRRRLETKGHAFRLITSGVRARRGSIGRAPT